MREIGDTVGLASLSSVTHQLSQLENLGYLRRDPKRPRAMEVLMPLTLDEGTTDFRRRGVQRPARGISGSSDRAGQRHGHRHGAAGGRIAAGGPILADQVVEDVSRRSPASWWARASSLCSRWPATR